MDASSPPSISNEHSPTPEAWPSSLEATREQLKKAELRIERYRAALRLAGVEIDQRNRGLMALTTFAYQASRTANLANLLRLALVQTLETTGASMGAIVLIDAETKALTLGVHKDLTPALAQILTGQELGRGATALMPHLVAGAGALLEAEDNGDDVEQALLATAQVNSLVSVPLQVGPRLLGAVVVGLHEARCFKPAELCFLMAVGQETATALESLRLREGVWHTAEILLGGELTAESLAEMKQEAWKLEDAPAPFELLAQPSAPAPQPAEDDMEQLLAAMMEAEDEVQQQNADLQRLNAISEMLNSSLDLQEILQCAAEQAQALLQTDAAWIYLIEEGRAWLEMKAHVGLSQTYIRGMHRLQPGQGCEGYVAEKNQPHFVETTVEDSDLHKIWVDKEGLQALAAAPINRPKPGDGPAAEGSLVLGVLAVGKRGRMPYHWSPREIRLLGAVSNQLALAVENALLYARVQDKEVSMRTGNEVLRTINDMLLEKNAFLEGFIQEDLAPMLAQASHILQTLLAQQSASGPAANGRSDRLQNEDMAALRGIVDRLAELSAETDTVGKMLDAEFNNVMKEKEKKEAQSESAAGPFKPVRLEKKPPPPPPPPEAPVPPAPEPGASDRVKPKAMSFEEAVAAGLVPTYLLDKETKRPAE